MVRSLGVRGKGVRGTRDVSGISYPGFTNVGKGKLVGDSVVAVASSTSGPWWPALCFVVQTLSATQSCTLCFSTWRGWTAYVHHITMVELVVRNMKIEKWR